MGYQDPGELDRGKVLGVCILAFGLALALAIAIFGTACSQASRTRINDATRPQREYAARLAKCMLAPSALDGAIPETRETLYAYMRAKLTRCLAAAHETAPSAE